MNYIETKIHSGVGTETSDRRSLEFSSHTSMYAELNILFLNMRHLMASYIQYKNLQQNWILTCHYATSNSINFCMTNSWVKNCYLNSKWCRWKYLRTAVISIDLLIHDTSEKVSIESLPNYLFFFMMSNLIFQVQIRINIFSEMLLFIGKVIDSYV